MVRFLQSSQAYSAFFDLRMDDLLCKGCDTEPGVLVCACANAFSCEADFCRSGALVAECFRAVCAAHPEYVLDPQDSNQTVLKQIVEKGFLNIPVSRLLEMGPYEVALNSIRALRPSYGAAAAKGSIFEPVDTTKFNFTSPEATCLELWEGEIAGRQATLIYNMFPFANKHVSILPDAKKLSPQFMTEDIHSWLWDVMAEIGQGIEGMVCGYNSTAGYASVNHFHGQLALEPNGLPVMKSCWAHNGGTKTYPANVLHYTNKQACWQTLEHMIKSDIAHNMLFMPGRAYLYPRRKQGSIVMPEWSGGIAWSELSGRMVITDERCIGLLSWMEIEEALSSVTLV